MKENLKEITELFSDVYIPEKAILIYRNQHKKEHVYVEGYDMDSKGQPINAHPFSVRECTSLAAVLQQAPELASSFLQCRGVLPRNVLRLQTGKDGYAVWYTPARKEKLLFKADLGIDSGKAFVPPLIWAANRQQLSLYAFKGKGRPTLNTPLFHAPFFNIYSDGKICMGNVRVAFTKDCTIEDFIAQWQQYFYNSYFSHAIAGGYVIRENIVQLWQKQVREGGPFPLTALKPTSNTLKNLFP